MGLGAIPYSSVRKGDDSDGKGFKNQSFSDSSQMRRLPWVVVVVVTAWVVVTVVVVVVLSIGEVD